MASTFPIFIASLLCLSSSLAAEMCLEGCKCTNQMSETFGKHLLINCSNLALTGVPKDLLNFQNTLPPIRLLLSNNMITRVSRADFPENVPVIGLDFSHNRGIMITDDAFSNIQSLKSLYLNNVSLPFSDKLTYLRGMKQLRHLSLNKNYQFGAGLIPATLLADLELDTLIELRFHDCYLKGIENGAFSQVLLIGNLDLGANQLDHIPEELRTLKNITSLDISQNSIKNIPNNSFLGMTNLKTLSISNNYISEISLQRGSFNGLRLHELVMERSVLNTIPTEALAMLTSLKILKLKNNPIKSIPMHSFNGTLCLEYLDLTNVLVEIDMVHLNGLERCLRTLYLSNMQIREVPKFLKNFQDLEYLSLSGNSISVIKTDDFVGTSISKVSLAENPLSEIQPGAFEPFPHAINLVLTGTRLLNLSFIRDYPYGTIRDIELGNILPVCACDLAFAEYRVSNIYGNCNLNDTKVVEISTEEFMEVTSHCWPEGRKPYKKDVWVVKVDSSSYVITPFTIAYTVILLLSLIFVHSV